MGYLSAANDINTDATTVTFDGAGNPDPNVVIGSVIYDHLTNDAYLAEVGEEIYKIDGLADTSAATVT